jgi:hypothetical protein
MSDLTQLNDESLRTALFDTLVERFEAQAEEDHSISVLYRMPTAFAVSRRGNLLTLSQGLGPQLLRGDLKRKDRQNVPRTFNVRRATIHPRLVITPDRVEGTPDEILAWIIDTFLDRQVAADESRPAVPAAAAPSRQAFRAAAQEQPARPASSTPERKSAGTRATRETRPASTEATRPPARVTEDGVGAPPPGNAAREAGAGAAASSAVQRKTAVMRTYQLLFETARRELEQAKALPAGRRYFLIGAGVFVAFTAEAFLNDLGSRVIPSWSQLQRLDPREKAEVLSIELFNDKVDWSTRPFQSVVAALGFRRALALAHAETLSLEQTQAVGRSEREVPRTRRTTWQEHCDVATIQRWISDVRIVIETFSKAHDPSVIPIISVE